MSLCLLGNGHAHRLRERRRLPVQSAHRVALLREGIIFLQAFEFQSQRLKIALTEYLREEAARIAVFDRRQQFYVWYGKCFHMHVADVPPACPGTSGSLA